MTRIRMGLLLGLLLLAVGVAACGGDKGGGVASFGGAGSATSTTTRAGASSDLTQAALAYGRCMRQHGIDMPDPQIDGDRIVQRPPDHQVKTPKFAAARQACRKYLPTGGPPPSPPSAQQRQQALAFARCMRQHGIDMADPEIDAAGRAAMQMPSGVGPDSPKFKAAQQACQQYAPDGGQPPKLSPQQQQQQLVAFARCMRQQGINLPDPTPDGGIDERGIGVDPDGPKFKAAEQACKQYKLYRDAQTQSNGGGK
jgi:hypothetical protein